MHCSPTPQAWPQAPQLAGSVARFLQPLPQHVSEAPHTPVPLHRHWPPLQCSGAVHACPHAPQLSSLVARLVQAAPQQMGESVAHCTPLQRHGPSVQTPSQQF
jgi:hypothetical protein